MGFRWLLCLGGELWALQGFLVSSKYLLESSIQGREDRNKPEVCSPLWFILVSRSILGEELTPNLVHNSLSGEPLRLCLSGLRTDREVCVCQLERPTGLTLRRCNPPESSRTRVSAHSCLFIGLLDRDAQVASPCDCVVGAPSQHSN